MREENVDQGENGETETVSSVEPEQNSSDFNDVLSAYTGRGEETAVEY